LRLPPTAQPKKLLRVASDRDGRHEQLIAKEEQYEPQPGATDAERLGAERLPGAYVSWPPGARSRDHGEGHRPYDGEDPEAGERDACRERQGLHEVDAARELSVAFVLGLGTSSPDNAV